MLLSIDGQDVLPLVRHYTGYWRTRRGLRSRLVPRCLPPSMELSPLRGSVQETDLPGAALAASPLRLPPSIKLLPLRGFEHGSGWLFGTVCTCGFAASLAPVYKTFAASRLIKRRNFEEPT